VLGGGWTEPAADGAGAAATPVAAR